MFWMFYAFFWVIPRRLNFKCRRFGTLCLFRLHRQVGASRDPSQLVSVLWTAPNLSPSVLMAQANSETNLFPYNTSNMPPAEFILHAPTCIWRWNRQSVPKRLHLKFRRPGITQKKAYKTLSLSDQWLQGGFWRHRPGDGDGGSAGGRGDFERSLVVSGDRTNSVQTDVWMLKNYTNVISVYQLKLQGTWEISGYWGASRLQKLKILWHVRWFTAKSMNIIMGENNFASLSGYSVNVAPVHAMNM